MFSRSKTAHIRPLVQREKAKTLGELSTNEKCNDAKDIWGSGEILDVDVY
jgi:hypothetical protein